MTPNTFTTLKELFPKDYIKISSRINVDPELGLIIHDLVECKAALSYWRGKHDKGKNRTKMYQELLEDLKEEVQSRICNA